MDILMLFGGAFLDALIGPNLIVMGEPFLLAAGYLLQQGTTLGVIAVIAGAIVGDHLSFGMGRYWGNPIQKKLIRKFPKLRRVFARARILMRKKGAWVITFARLLGPISWVVPFIAGSHGYKWRKFAIYDSIGILLGVGQFVAWGYLIATGLETFNWLNDAKVFVAEHKVLLGFLFAFGVLGIYWLKNAGLKKTAIRMAFVGVIGMLSINYHHFFIQNLPAKSAQVSTYDQKNWLGKNFQAFPGLSKVYSAQAVNLIYVGESPNDLMKELGWIENQTFSRDKFRLTEYVDLLKNQTPPISDLYWNNEPQWFAYQQKGDLLNRSHVRWWYAGHSSQAGQPVWVGAISYDAGLKVSHYKGIVTVLHKVDPNVDEERDRLGDAVATSQQWESTPLKVADPSILNDQQDYYSDGYALVIQPRTIQFNTASLITH
ncbi:putative SNARE associated Golgi protein [Vibrio nigripulchritudo SO65]|uniref:LssY C-terminal domain-containing protein n=1 Tax=Vibrio nigripulchritudo TaxID=28173 RepID=UPI0003B1C34E|nr:LssY C-terminal domain-containing protein [Vibrio nigripulchritudo]CCN37601.1 putative SNARE associated Golgi protein [Vibrio nigripulchritudo AM115]CCN39538.1 putative SNARE associated Golgi protein [Vibrio nigripulchritudo FTn2]CCN66836.1 putative SNARE associated Golgi protein [Vibrio nigripulchritudo POn4]CCN75639.1 putative SNARE associated Golgi protein [Vibrio nigripulchritudo SO65]